MKSPFLLLLLFSASTLLAQPDSGTAAAGDPVASVQSGDWMDIATWDCDCIPTESSEVAIQAGHDVWLDEGDTAHAASMVIAENASMDLRSGARVELMVALASIGSISGSGWVALVGDDPKTCGPAGLTNLSCGTGLVTLTDTVTITGELALESAQLTTQGKLVLAGAAGVTNEDGTISGSVTRKGEIVKSSSYTMLMSTDVDGLTADAITALDGVVYLKKWLEPNTGYATLTGSDAVSSGVGHVLSIPAGTTPFAFTGSPVLAADVEVTAEAGNPWWQGWNLLANPLTGYADIGMTTTGIGHHGATYTWVDSLLTYVVQVDGLGMFGHRGIFTPGEAFWMYADTTFTWTFGTDALVSKDQWEEASGQLANGNLGIELEVNGRREQCMIDFGTGSDTYHPHEDAAYSSIFKGRNDLDVYSESADGVKLMVNRTDGEAQVIPVWVQADAGETVTLKTLDFPENTCIVLEDLVSGWTGALSAGFQHAFEVTHGDAEHRFNLVVMGGVEASATAAACASASDGSVAVTGPDPEATFTLLDSEGNAAGTFAADSTGGVFSGLTMGTYTVTAISDGCIDLSRTVEVGAGGSGNSLFTIDATPDHIGCYDDHGGVALEIEGGLAPYTVTWSHGDTGESIEVEAAGILEAVITDATGCSDSTTVEVLAAPHVQAGIEVTNPVLTLIDGEAEVHFENTSTGATGYQWNFGDGATSIAENPLHAYTAAGAYTVGLNAWNDYCSDTYQVVVTVETVSAVGDLAGAMDASIERTTQGWSITHTGEAFEVEVFDLTGRLILTSNGMPGLPAMLDVAAMPPVGLVHWRGLQTGQQGTWRVAR